MRQLWTYYVASDCYASYTQRRRRIPGAVVYLDDIVVHGTTSALHDDLLSKVLDGLADHNLTLNGEKNIFAAPVIEFVGFRLTAEGLSPLHSNVDVNLRLPEPYCPAQLSSFLGITTVMVSVIEDLVSNSAACLTSGKTGPLPPPPLQPMPWPQEPWTHIQVSLEGPRVSLARSQIAASRGGDRPTTVGPRGQRQCRPPTHTILKHGPLCAPYNCYYSFFLLTSFCSRWLKEHIFSSKKLDTCSVVGNGGILINSTCGKQIDSAQFVFRCNLPPVDKRFKMHVGNKTDLVTANPSIFYIKFASLNKKTQFLETMQGYGSSYLLLPAFSSSYTSGISIRAAQVIKEPKSPVKPVFANPKYLKKLHSFWSSLGLREARLSTGFMIVSLALEVCKRVDLYGFWPFEIHPERFNLLTNHYYDNVPAQKKYHTMPSEFESLLQLHSKGVLRIHLGDCQPGED
ncbi:uncharacterized protein LOC114478812 [Gouania willdenowi]|uniref:uncharacterized protein LOC114478812 n=1 Tax=Gouania willdenowi TaxID=441366 RepID=UPI001055D350|nr:uncharacterized protein LOC114478812 [Gouania willdenowi]